MKGNRINLFNLEMSNLSLEETVKEILRWLRIKKGGSVYCCTLNEVTMANDDKRFKEVLRKGNLLTLDGMPLVWLARLKGAKAMRVYGPDLLSAFLELKEKDKINCLFIGDEKNRNYFKNYGEYMTAPYRNIFTDKDYQKIVKFVKESKSQIVWIALGAKKQIEMSDRLKNEIPDKVFITVGAAFDFLSGIKKQAPIWMRKSGLEWLFRLISEPRRLGKRYLKIVLHLPRNIWRIGA